jgi:hypothetical protein
LPAWLALCSLESYGYQSQRFPKPSDKPQSVKAPIADKKHDRQWGKIMRKLLLIVGFLALAVGMLWIGQGTGAIAWPQSSFMINQIQWAGYGAALAALGLILIWQGKR